jgi:predicted hydrolase (HD superfamily)
MPLPTREDAQAHLEEHVQDEYQRYHALMVATAMVGYARLAGADEDLWYITGLVHDIDFEEWPQAHPGRALEWFREWDYPEELIHAVEAHAYGYNGFFTLPETKLAATLLASDEMSGIFYAYRKMNPISYGEMDLSSIKKKFQDKTFATRIDRALVTDGCERLGIDLDEHIKNLIDFFGELK